MAGILLGFVLLILFTGLLIETVRFIFWILTDKMDPHTLQNQKQRFTLRLLDGGYSKTHEKFEEKKNLEEKS